DAGVPEVELTESLYDFFAEELHRGLEAGIRGALAILAEMPLIDRELAAAILGEERAATVCDEALRLGLFDERDRYLDFHPLLRSYFERRADEVATKPHLWTHARAHYKGRGELDAAFELTERAGGPGDVDQLVSDSMTELLDGARLPTLETWVSRAVTRAGETPAVRLAQAEIALRQGRHLTA